MTAIRVYPATFFLALAGGARLGLKFVLVFFFVLDPSDNELATFPLEFCGLKHLDLLDLSRNKIAEVPDGVATLQVRTGREKII